METPASEVVSQIVALRRVRPAVGSAADRQRLAHVIRQLRRQLGAGVPKRQVAAVLGVSVQALDRWIAADRIPVVHRPGSSRELVKTDALLALAETVTRLRERSEPRPLAGAIAALDEQKRLRQPLRPNQTARELRYEFLHSTPAGRMRQSIELSHFAAALAASGPTARNARTRS